MALPVLIRGSLTAATLFGVFLNSPNILVAQDLAPRFETHVAPILKAHCHSCHGPSLQQAKLDLQTRNGILAGGKAGPAIVPRDPVGSLLLQKIAAGSMPPGEAMLEDDQIELIRRWIETGALSEGEDPDTAAGTSSDTEVNPREIIVATLNVKCLLCHGRRRQEGGLDIRTRDSLLRSGVSGPAIVPGKPEESLLIKRIVAEQMPPEEHQARLSYRPITSTELQQLRRWIADGAPFDEEKSEPVLPDSDPLVSDEDRRFWSFQPPRRAATPVVRGQGPRPDSDRRFSPGKAGRKRPDSFTRCWNADVDEASLLRRDRTSAKPGGGRSLPGRQGSKSLRAPRRPAA